LGSIAAVKFGIQIRRAPGTAVNDGNVTVTGSNGIGVAMQSGGAVVNYGSIAATGTNGHAVTLSSGGSVTNGASATITSNNRAVEISGGAGSVVNYGDISGLRGAGVRLAAGGSVTNAASASIVGGYRGVFVLGDAGTVVNDGSVVGTVVGTIALEGMGTVGFGVQLAAGGTVTNAASASIMGDTFGVNLSAGGTLINAGSVIGNSATAVYLGGTTSNLLVLDPGYGLSGLAIGGTSASNRLELTSAASAGTLSGLGTEFVNFQQTTLEAGASWVFSCANTIEAGTTLTELSGSNFNVTGTR
jgi:hypothetical protein